MKNVNILISFEREINKLDDTIEKPLTDDSLYWLNQAVSKFIKTRFNGSAPHYTSYEQNEKRTVDLSKLISSKTYTNFTVNTNTNYESYTIDYPQNFMFTLNEDVNIASKDINNPYNLDTCVFECTSDSFMYRVNNSLTDFHYRHHRARPLRIRTNNGVSLLTDGNYKISKYTLGYLRKPTEITLDNPLNEYTDFPDIIIPEIVKIAAEMYIENKNIQQRYQTLVNEVNTQE